MLTTELRAALPAAREDAMAVLAPATNGDFKRTVGPLLSLVAPAGMSEEDQTAWVVAARSALSGIPTDLLATACATAMRKVDHPSKIVSTIYAEVGAIWQRRQRDLSRIETLERIARDGPPAAMPWERRDTFDPSARCTPEQAAAIIADEGLPVAVNREKPAPATVETYMQMGLSRHDAEQAVADHARMMGRGAAKPVAQASQAISGSPAGDGAPPAEGRHSLAA